MRDIFYRSSFSIMLKLISTTQNTCDIQETKNYIYFGSNNVMLDICMYNIISINNLKSTMTEI